MTLTIDTKKKILALSLLCMLVVPIFVNAQDPVEKTGITYDCANERGDKNYGECTFRDVLLATQKILAFARNLALFFSVIVLVVAGFKYMISGDKPAERQEANKMFKKVAIGIFFVMSAWLIVTLITDNLLKPDVSTIIQNNKPN